MSESSTTRPTEVIVETKIDGVIEWHYCNFSRLLMWVPVNGRGRSTVLMIDALFDLILLVIVSLLKEKNIKNEDCYYNGIYVITGKV